MSASGEIVLIFNSMHRVLHAEEILEASGAEFRVLQVPRRLTSDCGLAIRVEPGSVDAAARALVARQHLPEEAHRLDGRDYVPVVFPPSPESLD